MEANTTDNLKMEILSTRPHSLTLEARHTISLEVSKQRSLRVANSLFLPRQLPNKGLLALKQSEKEPSNMNTRPPQLVKINPTNPDTTSQPNEKTNSPGLGVIIRFPPPNSSSTPNLDQSNGESRPSSRRENVSRTPFNWNEPINHSAEVLRTPSRTTGLEGKRNLPTTIRAPVFNIRIKPNEIIEISSDEEDTKDEVKKAPPPSRYTTTGGNKPRSAMPLPMPSTPMQRGYTARRHRREYPSIQPIIIPPIMYPVLHGCHQSSNHQSGFYNDLYSDLSRSLALYPSRMSPEGRYRSYEDAQRVGDEAEVRNRSYGAGDESPNPYADQIYDRPIVRYRPYEAYQARERLSRSNQPHSEFPRNLPPIDISNWMAPRYTRQAHYRPAPTPQPNHRSPPTPGNGQPGQEPSHELVPFGNPLQSFYERMHEIYQAGLNHELPPPPPQPPYWLPDSAAAAAVDYAVALIRDAGNNWRRSHPQRRMDYIPAQVNIAVQRSAQTPPSPVPEVDSTTENNSPSSTTNTSRPVFPQTARNAPNAPNAPNVRNLPNVPNVSLQDMMNNHQAPNVEISPNNRNPFIHKHKPTLRSMLNEPIVPPKIPNMPNAANIRNAEDIPLEQRNRLNILNIHNLPNVRISENEHNGPKAQNVENAQSAEQTARNNHALNLAHFQNAQNLQYLLHMQNKNDQNVPTEQTARNKHMELLAMREQAARNRINARNKKNEEKNARNEQSVPNTHNAPNVSNMPNMSNMPNASNMQNYSNLQSFASFSNFQNTHHIPHAAHAPNGKTIHGNTHNTGQMIPNIPNATIVRNGQRYQLIQNTQYTQNAQQSHSRPNIPNMMNNFIPRFPPPAPPPPTPNIPNNRFNTRAQPSRPGSRVSSSAVSPAMSQMSLNENGSQESPRNKPNSPEYDPRDNR